MDFKINSLDANVNTPANTAFISRLTETYQKLFDYSIPELTIIEDLPAERLEKLNTAWHTKNLVLVTLDDERQIIGRVQQITTVSQVVLATYHSNVIEFVPLNRIFKVESATK